MRGQGRIYRRRYRDKLSSEMVTKYVVERQAEGAANATVNREQAALKRMYRLASEKLGGYCPALRMLDEDNVRQGFFERPAFEAVLDGLPDELRPVMVSAYITGWRIKSELLSRHRHHVDLGAGWLRLEPGETKNRKGRMFPLIPQLRAVLEEQKAHTAALEREQARIISAMFHRAGKPIRSFYGAWRTACTAAGVPGRILHDFRRTA